TKRRGITLISFGIKYWLAFIVIVLIGAAGVAVFLYFRNGRTSELTRKQQILLTVLRFFSTALIAFLLLSPFLKNLKKIVQNPVIIAAWDNSGSVISTADSAQLAQEILQVKNRITSELGNDYTLINYTFGQDT